MNFGDEEKHPAWCKEHNEPAWIYNDGSGSCFYCCVVETSCDCTVRRVDVSFPKNTRWVKVR